MNTRELCYRSGTDPHNQAQIIDGHQTIAVTYGDEDGKTAAELVRRWNDHAELLKAIEDLVQHLEYREDFIVEDAEEGESNAYSRAVKILQTHNAK